MTEPAPEAPKELRDARDRAVERAEKAEADALAAQSELRQFKAQTTFEKQGLTPKHADLFLKANPEAEVTVEAVTDFAHEYGLHPAAPSEDPPPVEPNPDAGAAALAGAGGSPTGGAAPAAQAKMSRADFEQLLATNPQQAAELYAQGQVERNPRNVQARELVSKGIIDH